MSSTWPEPPPGVRRIVTGHDDTHGHAIVVDDGPIAPGVGPFGPHIRGATIWVTTETPTQDNIGAFVDGGERTPDGSFGLSNAHGANVRTTDLAPGTVVPMVCTCLSLSGEADDSTIASDPLDRLQYPQCVQLVH